MAQTESTRSNRRNRDVAGDEQDEVSFESVLQQQLPPEPRTTEVKTTSVTEGDSPTDSNLAATSLEPPQNRTANSGEAVELLSDNAAATSIPTPTTETVSEAVANPINQTPINQTPINQRIELPASDVLSNSTIVDSELSETTSTSLSLSPNSGVDRAVDQTATVATDVSTSESTDLEQVTSDRTNSFPAVVSTSEMNTGKDKLQNSGTNEIPVAGSFAESTEVAQSDLRLPDNPQTNSVPPTAPKSAFNEISAQQTTIAKTSVSIETPNAIDLKANQQTQTQVLPNDELAASAENKATAKFDASTTSGDTSEVTVGPVEAVQESETIASAEDSPLRREQKTDQRTGQKTLRGTDATSRQQAQPDTSATQSTAQTPLLESITRGLDLSQRKKSDHEGISIGQELTSSVHESSTSQTLSINNNIDAPTSTVSLTTATTRSERPTPLLQQVFDAVKDGISTNDNSRSITVRLRDPYVGDLQIHLQRQDDSTLVKVAAADDVIFAMLTSRSGELGEQLKASDLQLQEISHISGSLSDQSRFDQAASGHQERQSSAEMQRQHHRSFRARQPSTAQGDVPDAVLNTKISFRA